MKRELKFTEKVKALKEINQLFDFTEICFHNKRKGPGLAKFINGNFYYLYFDKEKLCFQHPLAPAREGYDILSYENVEKTKIQIRAAIDKMKIKYMFDNDQKIENPNSLLYFHRSRLGMEAKGAFYRIYDEVMLIEGNVFEGKTSITEMFCILKNKLFKESNKTMGDLVVLLMKYRVLEHFIIEDKDIYPKYLVILLNRLNYILVDKKIGDFFYFEDKAEMLEYLKCKNR